MSEKILVTSHGFLTDPSSRGMFPMLAEAFPQHELVMFDHYRQYRGGGPRDTYMPSLKDQAIRFRKFISRLDGDVTILGHSRGTISACLAASLPQVERVVLLAPPDNHATSNILDAIEKRGGGQTEEGEFYVPRSDGESRTYISERYVLDAEAIEHYELYQNTADSKPTTIIVGTYDRVIDQHALQAIENVVYLSFPAGHNLAGEARQHIRDSLSRILGQGAVHKTTSRHYRHK